MKDLVYKFLDNYLGDEVVCECVCKPNNSNDWYIIRSTKNDQRIFDFFVTQKNGELGLGFFSDHELCTKVKGYCGIDDPDHCSKYIKDWFGDKHGLKKVSDVLKFVPNYGEKILSL
jgi:hypothetical protein